MLRHIILYATSRSGSISTALEKCSIRALMNRENMKNAYELSAYLHIPFCEKKCIYCDFYSIENLSLRSDFVDLLIREIDLKLEANPNLAGRELKTIFFGGGTPSLLTPEELERII